MIKSTASIYVNAREAASWHFERGLMHGSLDPQGQHARRVFSDYLRRDLLDTLTYLGYFEASSQASA
jgi:hypothetical protein